MKSKMIYPIIALLVVLLSGLACGLPSLSVTVGGSPAPTVTLAPPAATGLALRAAGWYRDSSLDRSCADQTPGLTCEVYTMSLVGRTMNALSYSNSALEFLVPRYIFNFTDKPIQVISQVLCAIYPADLCLDVTTRMNLLYQNKPFTTNTRLDNLSVTVDNVQNDVGYYMSVAVRP